MLPLIFHGKRAFAYPRPRWGDYCAELDLVWEQGGKRYGIELQYADAPRLTPSMRHSLADLSLERLLVVHPGTQTWPLAPGIDVVPLRNLSI